MRKVQLRQRNGAMAQRTKASTQRRQGLNFLDAKPPRRQALPEQYEFLSRHAERKTAVETALARAVRTAVMQMPTWKDQIHRARRTLGVFAAWRQSSFELGDSALKLFNRCVVASLR